MASVVSGGALTPGGDFWLCRDMSKIAGDGARRRTSRHEHTSGFNSFARLSAVALVRRFPQRHLHKTEVDHEQCNTNHAAPADRPVGQQPVAVPAPIAHCRLGRIVRAGATVPPGRQTAELVNHPYFGGWFCIPPRSRIRLFIDFQRFWGPP